MSVVAVVPTMRRAMTAGAVAQMIRHRRASVTTVVVDVARDAVVAVVAAVMILSPDAM
jgi:hypothetical protein